MLDCLWKEFGQVGTRNWRKALGSQSSNSKPVECTHRLEDASTWTDNIRTSKFFACNMEHAL